MAASDAVFRWFVVPRAEFSDGDTGTYIAPKYHDRDGVRGHSGAVLSFGQGDDRFLARFLGTPAALDEIEREPDVRSVAGGSLAETEVADRLNQRFGTSRRAVEWDEEFVVQGRHLE